MNRDRKPRPEAKPRSRGGTLVGMFIGLIVGIIAALAVAWYITKTPVPFQKTAKPAEKTAESKPGESGRQVGAGNQPLPLPGKPGDKPLEKPRFDFYKILPGEEAAAPAPDTPAAAAPAPEDSFLQAGAFQDPADADNLKARLALMGIEASIQQVMHPDKGTLHRVRIGPFAKPEEMARVRSQLAQSGIQVNVVKAGTN